MYPSAIIIENQTNIDIIKIECNDLGDGISESFKQIQDKSIKKGETKSQAFVCLTQSYASARSAVYVQKKDYRYKIILEFSSKHILRFKMKSHTSKPIEDNFEVSDDETGNQCFEVEAEFKKKEGGRYNSDEYTMKY